MTNEEVLTIKEASDFLNVSVGTLRNWINEGKLPSRKVGKVRRFYKSDLVKLFETN